MNVGETAYEFENRTSVVLVIGVNGVGKTTSVSASWQASSRTRAKKWFWRRQIPSARRQESSWLSWANRAGVEIISGQEGSDPGAVVYDAIQAAKARHADVLLVDTAGRLHNKKNLMAELGKLNRIIEKEYPEAYRETLVVLDGTTGQNALAQAKAVQRGSRYHRHHPHKAGRNSQRRYRRGHPFGAGHSGEIHRSGREHRRSSEVRRKPVRKCAF